MKKFFQLILAILICQSAGLIGSVFTAPAIPTWYATLVKPAFNPPGWLFGPVWLTLYALMGISLYLIWQSRRSHPLATWTVILFIIHLFFNAIWSVIFFGYHQIFLALIDIAILWLMIVILIGLFWRIKKSAAYLMLPYLAWVSFALILNFSLWRLNS